MRTLGIDLGTRRVGLALSDEGGRFATPFDVLEVTSPTQARDLVLETIRREGVTRIAVGVPLNMDDTIGPVAREAAAWARDLCNRASVPLVLLDERLSSFEAETQLTDRKRGGEKMTRRNRKQRLDALAAASFLQAFLDGRLPALDEDDLLK